MKHLLGILFILAAAAASGCSDDGEDAAAGTGTPASKADTEKVCNEMCTETGFSASRVDSFEHETNCFCTGPGTVTPEACTKTCQEIGKPTSSPYKSSGATRLDACQCS